MESLALIIAFLSPLQVNLAPEPTKVENSSPEPILATITAYSELDSCHYNDCLMSSGKKAYIGAIACPRDMELGVKVEIDGKEYICEDRYNKNLSRRFDIFFGYGEEAHRKALEFGVKEMSVIIKE